MENETEELKRRVAQLEGNAVKLEAKLDQFNSELATSFELVMKLTMTVLQLEAKADGKTVEDLLVERLGQNLPNFN